MARLATTPLEGNREKRTMTVHPPATAQPTLCASQFKEPELQKDDWSMASVLSEGHAFMASRLNGSVWMRDTERMRDKESGPFFGPNCYFYTLDTGGSLGNLLNTRREGWQVNYVFRCTKLPLNRMGQTSDHNHDRDFA